MHAVASRYVLVNLMIATVYWAFPDVYMLFRGLQSTVLSSSVEQVLKASSGQGAEAVNGEQDKPGCPLLERGSWRGRRWVVSCT